MKVILAGYNLDHGTISNFKAHCQEKDCLTPETVAAAYARISRDPRPINELREIASREVEKARQSNRNIVFAMGHSSIAEHAVFNVDIIGVSRLVVEDIERSRLASFTEKSQRYVLLRDDFVLPREIMEAGCKDDFTAAVREQNTFYHRLYERLRSHVFDRHEDLAADRTNHSLLEGWAKEDARYVISLATETQLGMTMNARSMEHLIRRLASSPLSEGRELGRQLYTVVGPVAPSLIRYIEPTDYDLCTRKDLQDHVRELTAGDKIPARTGKETPPRTGCEVRLVHATPDADLRIIASLLHSSSAFSHKECLDLAERMTPEDKEAFVKTAFRRLRSHDSVLREFENVELHYELTVSATCFAQLKRHRMATITCQEYNPDLDVTVPPAVCETGMEGEFRRLMKHTEATYERIRKTTPGAAAYILTNAHRRRVSMKINARELYHLARLRGDRFAQWDIRERSARMVELGKTVMPLTLMLATGKDDFASLHAQVCS